MTITDNAYGMAGAPWVYSLPGGKGATAVATLPVCGDAQGCWYDLTVTASLASDAAGVGKRGGPPPTPFTRRFMGRMETGRDTISDPAMAAGVPGYVPLPHTFATEEAWHAAMDAAFPVGTTGSRGARAQLAWGPTGIEHPDTLPRHRFIPREGAQGDHKDARWRWDPLEDAEL